MIPFGVKWVDAILGFGWLIAAVLYPKWNIYEPNRNILFLFFSLTLFIAVRDNYREKK